MYLLESPLYAYKIYIKIFRIFVMTTRWSNDPAFAIHIAKSLTGFEFASISMHIKIGIYKYMAQCPNVQKKTGNNERKGQAHLSLTKEESCSR